MPRRPSVLALLLLLLLHAGPAAADRQAALAALQDEGTVLLLRHALAPGTGDPPGFRLDDCTTQRNLNEAGRQQAAALGGLLRGNGVADASVLTSRWCRARETAELLDVGPVREAAFLDSFFADRAKRTEQTAHLRRAVADWEGPGLLVLVTHQVNITALTGYFPRSGEALVLRSSPFFDTEIELLGSLLP